MSSIVHVTPGNIDIRAFTTFGLHAKPNSDAPIGKFGTGLKYAISTLLRLDCKVRLFIGLVEYEFFTKPGNFRGMEFMQVNMRKRNSVLNKWVYEELPFTTDHGRHWEAWQAFRELHSNTLDEGGETTHAITYKPSSDQTLIMVSGEAYETAFHERNKIFLPDALTKREGDETLQVFNEPSDHLYWRGIRVFDLEQPSIYTYNILDNMTLTEDRTLKYVWEAQSKIAAYVARSKDRKMIQAIVKAEAKKHFEARLDWDYAYTSPSAEFKEVVALRRARGSYIAPMALAFYDRYTPAPAPATASLKDRINEWAYSTELPDRLKELMQYLLKCEIKEPAPNGPLDDEIPF